MALLDTTLNSMGDHLATLITHFSLHSADPGTTGANEQPIPAAWAASTAYALNDVRRPTTSNGFTYIVTTAGTSAATEPVWPTAEGSTVTDGTVVWTRDKPQYARVAATWSAAATGGDISDGPVAFTGLPANGAVTHVGYWSALTGGTFRGSRLLGGDTAANAAGEYTVTSVAENGSSS